MSGQSFSSRLARFDAEVAAFIAESEAFYADLPAEPTVEEERAAYDRMAAHFRAPRPPGLAVSDEALATDIGAVAIRRYRPERRAGAVSVVYFHGGGFVFGGLDSHDDVCAEIAAKSGCETISVDYRLAPEHPHPAGYLDGLAVARTIGAERPTLLVGDSVGGAVAAAASIELRGSQAAPVGQVLIYPGLGGQALDLPSYRAHAEAPLLSIAELNRCYAIRAGGAPPYDDVRFAPLAVAARGGATLAGVAPCAAFPAADDPLADDAATYVDLLRTAKVPASLETGAGLVHGCLRARHGSARARAYMDAILSAIMRLAQLDAPFPSGG